MSLLIALAASLALFLGIGSIAVGSSWQRRTGLGEGRTVSLDRLTLTSSRLGLTGRPDRIIRIGDQLIIEEWKSSLRVRPGHVAQIGVYFLLAEERFGIRPSHGVIVCGDGTRHRIDNTAELRERVLAIAGQIRAARHRLTEPLPVNPTPAQCRACGQRKNCRQSRG